MNPAAQNQTENALRIAKHREKQRQDGKAQINITLPIELHASLKSFASRIKSGMKEVDAAHLLLEEIRNNSEKHPQEIKSINFKLDNTIFSNKPKSKNAKENIISKIRRKIFSTRSFKVDSVYKVANSQQYFINYAKNIRIETFGFHGGPVVTAERRTSVRWCTAAIRGVLLLRQELLRSQFWSRRSC